MFICYRSTDDSVCFGGKIFGKINSPSQHPMVFNLVFCSRMDCVYLYVIDRYLSGSFQARVSFAEFRQNRKTICEALVRLTPYPPMLMIISSHDPDRGTHRVYRHQQPLTNPIGAKYRRLVPWYRKSCLGTLARKADGPLVPKASIVIIRLQRQYEYRYHHIAA